MEKNPSAELLKATAAFAADLYRLLARKDGNVFFSPLSVHAVLSMLYHGAQGDTQQALLHTLKSADADGYHSLLDHLAGLPSVQLVMANKLFGNRHRYKLNHHFLDLLKGKFLSEAELLDVANPKQACQSVNEWVEAKTEGKIRNIVKESLFTEELSVVLINAIYFKGLWASQFEASATRKDQFFLQQGQGKEVQMMCQKGKYEYKHDEELDAQVLLMPYRGLGTSMVIVLPSEKSGVKELEGKLAKGDLTTLWQGLQVTEVRLFLPKFKMEETVQLNDILREMGLSDIFDMNKADFGKIIDTSAPSRNLYVSEIIQKAFVKVDEAGTEAAAATRAGMMVGCAPGKKPEPVTFKVNRAALFMLVADHGEAGKSILFYGRLSEPAC